MAADVLPAAVAIALSPFPIIPVIVLLFTSRAMANAASFLGGWAGGILAATAVFVLLAEVVQARDHAPSWASWARIAIGAALVGFGARQWVTRRAQTEPPAWMQSLESATPRRALRLGLLLSAANPKILLLTAAGGLAIGTQTTSTVVAMAATLGFTLVAACTVAVPVALYAVRGDAIVTPLGVAKDWLQAHNAAVMAVVVTVIGLVLLVKGLTAL